MLDDPQPQDAQTRASEAEPASPAAVATPFRLGHHFAWRSLLGFCVAALTLLWLHVMLSSKALVRHEGQANAALTQVFANTVWARHRAFVLEARSLDTAALLADARYARLDQDVRASMRGLPVLALKIFSPQGRVIFSTDRRQVGDQKHQNPGLASALQGQTYSELDFRQHFDAIDGALKDRDLIASYVPARVGGGDGQAPDAVFEVYSDVTQQVQYQRELGWQLAFAVILVCLGLYGFLSIVVRRADRLLAVHERERELREGTLRQMAHRDPLTGLPNRAGFRQGLAQTLAQLSPDGPPAAVLFIDLDRFKAINDRLGHKVGDAVLKQAAAALGAGLRDRDQLCRLGGDEFVAILPRVASPDHALAVASRLVRAVSAPMTIGEHRLQIGASIGLAMAPLDGQDVDTLARHADLAMYAAKRSGGDSAVPYHQLMNDEARLQLELENDLYAALRDEAFELFYQPRVDSRSLRIVGVEALLRWRHPVRGLVLPGQFIATLERLPLMKTVGDWVLRTAIEQLAAWSAEGLPPLRMSINVSAAQLTDETFVEHLQACLARCRVGPQSIELELTESMLVDPALEAGRNIERLHACQVRLAVDDFGVGYSSLNQLRQLQIDVLKIDRTFCAGVIENEKDRALTRAIQDMAQALHLSVVAEGIETEAQAAYFQALGCAELQGYLFARPEPVRAMTARLRR